MASFKRLLAVAALAATVLLPLDALADKVATLHARGTAPVAERTTIRQATDTGAKGLGHETLPENDVLQGEGAAGDKAGTSEGMIAIGNATGADWVVEPQLMSSESGARVELKVCQVATGRVETLARDLDPKKDPATQMREMLALMLRPQGVGDDPLPWEQAAKAPEEPPKEVLPKEAQPNEPARRWGEHGHVSLGAGGGVGRILVRDDRAVGSRTFIGWTLYANFAIPKVRGLEITARFAGIRAHGGALLGDVGARYMIPVGTFAFGAGLAIGGFGAFNSGVGGVSLGIDPTISWAVAKPLQIELALRNRYVPIAEPLLLTSAELGLLLRF
jgi:hypothetical protein